MASLRHNVVANFIGQIWTALIGVLFMPVYVRLLGMEAYGLIGVYISLQALLFVLDLGLSATLNRELARHARTGADAGSIHDLVRTLEWLFWPLCATVALLMVPASSVIATHWLQSVTFGQERVSHALLVIGLAIAAQWPSAFYAGGLAGLERQVSLNFANVVFATLRWVAVIPVLMWAGASIEVYLYWQVVVSVAQSIAMRGLLSRALPDKGRPAHFRVDTVRDVRGFALGMFCIALVAFVLVQADRIVLSRVLPLDQFGRYVLVATVAATLSRIFNPFFAALYPRYSGLVAAGQQPALVDLYHRSNQLLAVVVASVASVLGFFAEDVLRLWTHDPALAAQGAPILAILVFGTALNGLMNLPYALQLAYGWTRLTLYQNLVAVLVVVPATWWLAGRYGALGAASMWAALNLGYVAIAVPLMHRRLLEGEMVSWYRRDILPAALAAVVSAFAARNLLPAIPDSLPGVGLLAVASLLVLCITGLCASETRRLALDWIRR